MTLPASGKAAYDRVIGRRMRSISMATWLALAVLAVTVTALVAASVVSITVGDDIAENLSSGQLRGLASLKSDEVERYLSSLENRVRELAGGPELGAAAERFSTAYAQLGSEIDDLTAAEADVALAYRDVYGPTLEATLGVTIGWQNLLPTTARATYLQSEYVVLPELDPSEYRLVDDARDGTTWSETHRELHPRFLDITERLRLADLVIVDPSGLEVVYSAAKGLNFASSLDVGPHSGGALAALVRRVLGDPEAGSVAFADFSASIAHGGVPIAHFAAPVFVDGAVVGVLAFSVSSEELTEIMVIGPNGAGDGDIETSETYIVGRNGRMRSAARLFAEDPEAYLEQVAAAGTATESERTAMASTGTTAVFQSALSGDDVEVAFSGTEEAADRANFLGRAVRSTFENVDYEGVTWTVVSEVTVEEFDQPVADFRRSVLIAVTVFVIIVTFATVAWAGRAFLPLRAMSERLRKIHVGEELEGGAARGSGPREFADLAESIDQMLVALAGRQAELEAATEQRLDTVRSLLPPVIAERVEAGDVQVLDQIPQAGIVVLSIDGLGHTPGETEVEAHRAMLDRVLEVLDELATAHGLDRVKIVGDAYFAGCGLTQAFLDHAPRSVAFALDARSALREVADDIGHHIDVAAGIHVGPVTTGLSGSARLVYDLWGETVSTAHDLARSAATGEVLVSDQVRVRLPDDYTVVQRGEGTPPVWEVVGERVGQEAAP